MKKIFTLTYIISLFIFVGCKNDFIDIDVEGYRQAEDFFKTEEHAIRATNAVYSMLRSYDNYAFPYQYVFGMPADDVLKGSNPGDGRHLMVADEFKYTGVEAEIRSYWRGQWQGIARANQVITNVPNIDMNEQLRDRLVAEVRFIRAYFYFNLVRIFGGVPIFDGLQENYNVPRNSPDEVYNFIISDLNHAAGILPQSYEEKDLGRATKGSALGMLSKVYLYQKDWQKAFDTSNQVIALGYSLDPDFNHLFRVAGEYGTESVFEINCDCQTGFKGSQYSEVQGVRGQFGWGFFVPAPSLENAFEFGDIRKKYTLLINGETTDEGDIIKKGDENSVDIYNYKAYVPMSDNKPDCPYGSVQNIRVLRFAEILLINAEAANELGNINTAKQSLNIVRNRANLANNASSNQEELRKAIWHERRVELAMEGDRFVDLVRTGQAPKVLGFLGFTAGKNELFPIPIEDIKESRGVLVQNPGY